jgi:hypothetical protein
VFTARYEQNLQIRFRLVVCLSAIRPLFNPRPVPMTSMVDKATLGVVFLPVILSSPVSISPPMLHTHLRLYIALTKGSILKFFQKAMFFFWNFGRFWIESYFDFCLILQEGRSGLDWKSSDHSGFFDLCHEQYSDSHYLPCCLSFIAVCYQLSHK